MLEVQKYLRENKGKESLIKIYGINIVQHPYLPISIYNYDQLESPRISKITRECRCLILEDVTYDLVSRSFFRFFNLHEFPDEHKAFDWNNTVYTTEKVDGSLITVFYYAGEWHVTTRQSWAESYVHSTPKRWKELVFEAFPYEDMEKLLDKSISYTFELCSPYNKVVKYYNETFLVLLSAFYNEEECKDMFCNATVEIWNHLAPNIKVKRPTSYYFESFKEVEDWLTTHGNDDPTFEGFVLRDCNNYRVKVKSQSYLALARLKGEGNNLFHPKYIIPLVIDGEAPEALSYYPEATDAFNQVIEKLDYHKNKMLQIWERTKHIQDQKEFAENILTETPFCGILFRARKEKREPSDIWRESSDMIYNTLFKNKNVTISRTS